MAYIFKLLALQKAHCYSDYSSEKLSSMQKVLVEAIFDTFEMENH
jgi:hypothetical protein